MGPHVTSESEIGGTDSAALRTSWTCLRLCGSCVTSCTSFFRGSDPAIYKAPDETNITDSSPYISVACQSLQVTWLNVAIEKIRFDVVDEAFLWATNWTLSHSELATEQPTRQPVVRHSDNMPQPSQLSLEQQVFSRSYSSFLESNDSLYCRVYDSRHLQAKNRDQLRNSTLGNQVCATFNFTWRPTNLDTVNLKPPAPLYPVIGLFKALYKSCIIWPHRSSNARWPTSATAYAGEATELDNT